MQDQELALDVLARHPPDGPSNEPWIETIAPSGTPVEAELDADHAAEAVADQRDLLASTIGFFTSTS